MDKVYFWLYEAINFSWVLLDKKYDFVGNVDKSYFFLRNVEVVQDSSSVYTGLYRVIHEEY